MDRPHGALYTRFDPSTVQLHPVATRPNLVTLADVLPLDAPFDRTRCGGMALQLLTLAIRNAQIVGKPIVVFLGGHPIKLGLTRFLSRMIATGSITHLAINGAAFVHDWELACYGTTSEAVDITIEDGRFGFAEETLTETRDLIASANMLDLGLGQVAGATLNNLYYVGQSGRAANGYGPDRRDLSLLHAAHVAGITTSVHSGPIGADIFHLDPEFDGAKFGRVAHTDWLHFVQAVTQIGNGGVFLNIGSQVAGPELFLKALAAARNTAADHSVVEFTTAVFDLPDHADVTGPLMPEAGTPAYFQRWRKNVLVRPVDGHGAGLFIGANFRDSIPALHSLLTQKDQ